MKKIVLIAAILSSFTIISQAQKTKTTADATASKAPGESFTVTLKTPSYKSGLTYLCYHMGKNLNIEDSTYFNEQGVAIFKGDRKLMGGIYAVVFPGKNLTFDFFVDREQNLSIYADSADLQNVKITGSKANELFQQYQKFVGFTGMLMQTERLAYNASRTKADSTLHLEKYNKYNKELIDFRDKLMKENPESMMASMLNAMREPEILNKEPKTRQDTLDNYYYYKKHYWDGVSFTDDRVIRTPFFLPKLERYYREIVQQAPDSIIKDLDYKLLLARVSPEMYKFLLNWFTDEYINPKYMGQDAVFVHLFEKYHSKGVSSWLNEKQQETISRRAYMQMSNLIGVKAANLEMVDSTGKPKPLYGLNAEFTFIIFWDPSCGHCKEEIPRIDSIYRAFWKVHGVKIYAVLNDNDNKKDWINYIKENKIGDWDNVYETKEMEKAISEAQRPGFRQLYDVTQTPTIFLLDKEKRIIGKKLSYLQLNNLLRAKLGYPQLDENTPIATINKPIYPKPEVPKPEVPKPNNPSTENISNENYWNGNGTGFFVNELGYIATNYHVIDGVKDIQIQYLQGTTKKTYKPKVVKVDITNDLAVLKIDDPLFVPLEKISYNFKDTIAEVGTKVFTLGFPRAKLMGEEVKYTSGDINSKTGIKNDPTFYQISVPIQPGNSGGPLFDINCNLIGVTSSSLNKEIFSESENVNYAIKSVILKNLIDALPGEVKTPNDAALSKKSTTEKIKKLSNYIVLIKTRD